MEGWNVIIGKLHARITPVYSIKAYFEGIKYSKFVTWGSDTHNPDSGVKSCSDNFVSKFAMRDHTILGHIFEPGS